MQTTSLKLILVSVSIFAISSSHAAASTLTAEAPVALSGKAGKFDFMAYDSASHRVLAAHTGATSLAVLDAVSAKPVNSIDVGDAQGIAVDTKNQRYFLGSDSGHSIVFVDGKKLLKTNVVKVDGPVDAMAFDSTSGNLYAAEDEGKRVWVVSTSEAKVIGTVEIPGKPEGLSFDSSSNFLYLNIAVNNSLVRINPVTNKIDATWSTLPAKEPHGLMIDSSRNRAYVGGKNGKLVAIDLNTGKVISSVRIGTGNDQIAFDASKDLIYSACKSVISVTKTTKYGLVAVEDIISPVGSHSIVLDSDTQAIWIAYADKDHSYFQRYIPTSK